MLTPQIASCSPSQKKVDLSRNATTAAPCASLAPHTSSATAARRLPRKRSRCATASAPPRLRGPPRRARDQEQADRTREPMRLRVTIPKVSLRVHSRPSVAFAFFFGVTFSFRYRVLKFRSFFFSRLSVPSRKTMHLCVEEGTQPSRCRARIFGTARLAVLRTTSCTSGRDPRRKTETHNDAF